MHSEPMIAVQNVRKSAAWYCRLLDAENDHKLEEFDRIVIDNRVLLMLHRWGAEEHGAMLAPEDGVAGNGFLLWILVKDLNAIYNRAIKMNAEIVSEPKSNSVAGWREFTLRDLDGYHIAIAQFE